MAAGELIKGRFQKDKKRARNSQKRWYHGLSGPFPGEFEPPIFRLGGDCSILLSYGDMVIFFIISERDSLMIFEGTFGLRTTCLSEKNK